jgi:hypothetical protein
MGHGVGLFEWCNVNDGQMMKAFVIHAKKLGFYNEGILKFLDLPIFLHQHISLTT